MQQKARDERERLAKAKIKASNDTARIVQAERSYTASRIQSLKQSHSRLTSSMLDDAIASRNVNQTNLSELVDLITVLLRDRVEQTMTLAEVT